MAPSNPTSLTEKLAALQAWLVGWWAAAIAPVTYFAVIGQYSGAVMGVCVGESGKRDVLREEPGATFRPITRAEYIAFE